MFSRKYQLSAPIIKKIPLKIIYLLLQRRKFYKNKSFSLGYKKKPTSFYKQQEYLLESISGIGPKLAKSVLRHFGNIKKISNIPIEKLEKVQGIGRKKAKKIKSLLGN